MARCKYCQRDIDKIEDADICPYCGASHPVDEDYRTMDVTSTLKTSEESLYRSKSHKKYGLFCIFLGFLGIHEFYLGFKKKGFISLIISLILIGGVGTILFLLAGLNPILSYLLPFGIIYVIYIVWGIILLGKDNLRDSAGVYLR